MDLGLKGKTAVVSGSTAGIGFAIAATLAAEGAKVVVNGRTEARVSAALAQIRQRVKNADLRGVHADLGTSAGVEMLVKQVPEADILVNNLGIFEVKAFAEISDADWLRLFEVNVLSGVRLARHYLPCMLKRNWGRIIFISSESAQHIPVEMIHYGMTKTAQVSIARGLSHSVMNHFHRDVLCRLAAEALRDTGRSCRGRRVRRRHACRDHQRRCRARRGRRGAQYFLET